MIELGAKVAIRDREQSGRVVEVRHRLGADPGYIVEVTEPELDVIPFFGPFVEADLDVIV